MTRVITSVASAIAAHAQAVDRHVPPLKSPATALEDTPSHQHSSVLYRHQLEWHSLSAQQLLGGTEHILTDLCPLY